MAAITSAATGDSNATGTWTGGVVPVEGDKVTIQSGHIVTLNDTHIWGDDSTSAIGINPGGTLKFSRTASSSLTCKGTIINNGVFDMGTSASPIPDGVTAELVLNYSDTLAANKYGMTVYVGATGFTIFGKPRTINTVSTAGGAVGTNTISVEDATGWAINDIITVASTNTNGQGEDKIIQAISGNDLVLTSNFANAHATGALVGHFSSNVNVTSYDKTNTKDGFVYILHNASTLTQSREIQYAHFSYIGSAATGMYAAGTLFGVTFNGSGSTCYISLSNFSIRYSGYACIDISGGSYPFTFSNIALLSNGTTDLTTRSGSTGTFNDCVFYKSGNWNISNYSQGGVGVIFNRCKFVDCTSTGFNYTSATGHQFNDCIILCANAVMSQGYGGDITMTRTTFGIGPGTPKIGTVFSPSSGGLENVYCYDCSFEASNITTLVSTAMQGSNPVNKIILSNKNIDPLQQEIYTTTGNILRDNATYRTGAPSIRLEPKSATAPLTFTINAFAPNNKPVVVSGYIRKNAAYGSSNLPTVTLSGLGITPDTFTIADINDEWQQFKVQGTQTTGTDGMLNLTFSVQSAGAGAYVYVDDVVAPVASSVNVGEFGYWSNGLPVQAILANFVSANDVWNIQTNQLTLSGSIGEAVLTIKKWLGWMR